MAITHQNSLIHWNYFLALEDDLEKVSRYVDLSGNEATYSIEIARLLLASCSEIDVVFKLICCNLNNTSTADDINKYFTELNTHVPAIFGFEVTIPRFGLTLQPFSSWASSKPPLWWTHHNKVKHHRDQNFDKANLKNVINSLAALYITTLFLYKNEAENGNLQKSPSLFNVADQYFGGHCIGRLGTTFQYKLPI